ncbi:hypothetical protein [Streptomyces graminilatus]|uniref:hypothetical protein n=1 Tax=Streptomyces graminilatus TaxID=1464070 RepID=UPI0006E3704D|nr:hypothetical protein [Streptomyces graminilatus]
MHTPENLARSAAFKLEADARGRAVAEQRAKQPERQAMDAVGPADQQQRNSRGRGCGRGC